MITNGSSIGLYQYTKLQNIGNGRHRPVRLPDLHLDRVLLLATLVTRYTGYGRMIYAVGGNAEAARLAGINVVWIRISAYAICAGLAAFAGFLEAGRLAAAAPDTDTGIEFTAAAAVLLGGTSFVGGVGTMFGTFLGVLFLGVLQNGLIISSINIYYQNVITGAVLVLSVLIDRFRQSRGARRALHLRRPRTTVHVSGSIDDAVVVAGALERDRRRCGPPRAPARPAAGAGRRSPRPRPRPGGRRCRPGCRRRGP